MNAVVFFVKISFTSYVLIFSSDFLLMMRGSAVGFVEHKKGLDTLQRRPHGSLEMHTPKKHGIHSVPADEHPQGNQTGGLGHIWIH